MTDSVWDSPRVRRLHDNYMAAMKCWRRADDCSPEELEAWASGLNPESLKSHYEYGSLELGDLEGLLEFALRAERL